MKRLTRFQENISVKKATNYAIIINSLEILLILGVMTLVVISPQYDFSPRMMRLLVGVAAALYAALPLLRRHLDIFWYQRIFDPFFNHRYNRRVILNKGTRLGHSQIYDCKSSHQSKHGYCLTDKSPIMAI